MRKPVSFLWVLFTASFLLSFAAGLVNYGLIFYVKDLFHADKAGVGFISALMDLAYFVGIIAFLKWKKAPHPRFLLILATWGMALCVLIYLLIPSWGLTVFFHALFGLSTALFWPRIMGWLSWNREGPELAKAMGNFNLSWSLGGIFAPVVAGFLVEKNICAPLYSSAGVLICTGLIIILGSHLYPDMKRSALKIQSASSEKPIKDLRTPLRYPARLSLFGAYFFTGLILYIFPVFAKDSLLFSEALIGFLLTLRLVSTTLGFSFWGKFNFWQFKFWPCFIAQVLLLLLIPLAAISHAYWNFLLIFIALGLIFSFQYSYALFHGAAGSTNRERSMTIHEGSINVGLLGGTLLGGWISQKFNMSGAYLLCAVVMLLIALVQLRFRKPKQTHILKDERV